MEKSQFAHSYKKNSIVSLRGEMLGDLDTPVSTFLKTTLPSSGYRFLLESVEKGAQKGRYSIIGDDPLLIFSSKNGHSTIDYCKTNKRVQFTGDPFDALNSLYSQYTIKTKDKTPFAQGGLFGYLGYDSIRFIENLSSATLDDTDLPDIHLFIPAKIIVFDNLLNKILIHYFIFPNGNMEQDYQNGIDQITKIKATIQTSQSQNEPVKSYKSSPSYESNINQSNFENMVLKAKKYIKRGDAFQTVLAQRLSVTTDAHPFNIYRGLRVINPSPYMFYMEMNDACLLGSSPETLVKLSENIVFVKPIAGTRKRGKNEKEDQEMMEELLADEKEKAEHTMLVDLGRNDVGRISEFGSVQVKDFMNIEKYSHVIHIVSTVTGSLKTGYNAIDVFKACFPAGTVSGAPKVRAMEIIEELEPTRRSIYAGAVGYFGFNGDMDVCIAIRTIFIKDNKAYLQAGAGIVADSIPEKEYEETLNKARGLLKAVEYAQGGLL